MFDLSYSGALGSSAVTSEPGSYLDLFSGEVDVPSIHAYFASTLSEAGIATKDITVTAGPQSVTLNYRYRFNGEVRGYALRSLRPEGAHFAHNEISARYQRTGVGGAASKALLASLDTLGCPKTTLNAGYIGGWAWANLGFLFDWQNDLTQHAFPAAAEAKLEWLDSGNRFHLVPVGRPFDRGVHPASAWWRRHYHNPRVREMLTEVVRNSGHKKRRLGVADIKRFDQEIPGSAKAILIGTCWGGVRKHPAL